MRIELHDDDGHVYAFEQDKGDPFKYRAYVDGSFMPRMSEALDGRDVLWQMSRAVCGPIERAEASTT